MLQPTEAQIDAAIFLSSRRYALLASDPRTGKTGSSLMAWQLTGKPSLLVITTASGVAVWARSFPHWLIEPVDPLIVTKKSCPTVEQASAAIVSWAQIADPKIHHALTSRRWGRLIIDEAHAAKSPEAKRTKALYGDPGRPVTAIIDAAESAWALTGTPVPNGPADLWPMLEAMAPDLLAEDEARGWPAVHDYEDFFQRYCRWKPFKIGRGCYTRTIRVVKGGKNTEELASRIEGFMLRRTQQDVGIPAPQYEFLPLAISEGQRRRLEREAPAQMLEILQAADAGDTRNLDMHFGPLRRLTGDLKVEPIVQLVRDELECGSGKIVLMCWHHDVIEAVAATLHEFGAVHIHGGTPRKQRAEREERFRTDPACRVAVCQIQACGEAIDLSAADELIFVETSFIPKDMRQAALRVTNLGKKRTVRIRVAALAGSVDEALQSVVIEKVKAITELGA